jgi:hypothetical protein
MFGWLKGLFGSFERQAKAAERAAVALEDIAGDLEGVRDQFRARLGIEPKQLPAAAPAPEAEGETTKGKGRSR